MTEQLTHDSCAVCSAPIVQQKVGRQRIYCSDRCRRMRTSQRQRAGEAPQRRSKAWTDNDLAYAADTTLTAPDVAHITGHSVGSVRVMRHKLRQGWQPGRAMWSEDEDEFLRNAPNMTAEQIARQLGRSREAVTLRRHKIGCAPGTSQHAKPWVVDDRRLLAKTCPECGLLLGAEWFGRISFRVNNGAGERWGTYCSQCRQQKPAQKNRTYSKRQKKANSRRAVATHQRLQALTVPQATRGGQEWTERDFDVLADPNRTLLEKALTLKRTYIAVSRQAYTRGFKSKVGLGDVSLGVWRILFPNATKSTEGEAA